MMCDFVLDGYMCVVVVVSCVICCCCVSCDHGDLLCLGAWLFGGDAERSVRWWW